MSQLPGRKVVYVTRSGLIPLRPFAPRGLTWDSDTSTRPKNRRTPINSGTPKADTILTPARVFIAFASWSEITVAGPSLQSESQMHADARFSIANQFVERQNCGVRVSHPTPDEKSPQRKCRTAEPTDPEAEFDGQLSSLNRAGHTFPRRLALSRSYPERGVKEHPARTVERTSWHPQP